MLKLYKKYDKHEILIIKHEILLTFIATAGVESYMDGSN